MSENNLESTTANETIESSNKKDDRKLSEIVATLFIFAIVIALLFIYHNNEINQDYQEQSKAFNSGHNIICPTSLISTRVIINKNDGYEIFHSNDTNYYKKDKELYVLRNCFIQKAND